ncbi:MAG: hypothetical protein R3B13_21785 [Polyangiaceae bacterium]
MCQSSSRLLPSWIVGGFVVAACLNAGCGTVFSAASYTGTRYPPVVKPEQVQESATVPDDHEVIGHVQASCSNSSGDVEWTDVLLSDILCSEPRLGSTMRRKVAEVGGTMLVERSCDRDTDTETRTETKDGKEKVRKITTTHISCEGAAARPKPELVASRPEPELVASRTPPSASSTPEKASSASTETEGVESDADTPDTDESTVAWRIRLQIARSKSIPPQPAVSAEQVSVVETKPTGARVLANLVADCSKGCSKAAVQLGLREATAKLGGSALLGGGCASSGGGWICTGSALLVPPPVSKEPHDPDPG